MSEELCQMEISYAKEILREVYERFVANGSWDENQSLPEILEQKIIPHINHVKPKNDIKTAKRIFDIWKIIFKKPNAGYRNQFLNMIAHRLKEGYTEAQLVQGIIGLSRSDHHREHRYDTIYYVARTPQQLELVMGKAERDGLTLDRIETRLEEYRKNPEVFGKATDSGYLNPHTGRPMK